MQGVFVDGKRPKSKKAIKEAIARDPHSVRIQATSLIGREFDGLASELPEGTRVSFVGPDPYLSRKFYGTIRKVGGRLKVA
jgi:hypothetical protein